MIGPIQNLDTSFMVAAVPRSVHVFYDLDMRHVNLWLA
jgi:hypothetical protein